MSTVGLEMAMVLRCASETDDSTGEENQVCAELSATVAWTSMHD